MPFLVRNPDTLFEERYRLEPGTTTVGRARENTVVLVDPSLSRQHARVTLDDSGVSLLDLGSSNGTVVDGARVTTATLTPGCRIRFGDVTLQFVEDAPPEATPSAGWRRDLASLLGSPPVEDDTCLLRLRPDGPSMADTRLRLLLAASQLLSAPDGVDNVLSRFLSMLFEILDADRAAVLLWSAAKGRLESRLARMRSGPAPTGPIHSQTIARQVYESGEGTISEDATNDPRFAEAASVLGRCIRSALCVPMRTPDRTLGVLYVDHLSRPGRFGPEDLGFVSALATQGAIAIENATLHERLAAEAARRNTLARFFPPVMLAGLMQSPDFGRAEPHEVTVLFSDISGFTALSSTLPPLELVAFLNSYFPVMAEIVFRHEGTLEKYIGDALMAIWGAPLAHPDDADRAVRAAIEMQEAMARFNQSAGPGSELAIHIGLNTGPVAFGNIGSRDYVQFAAIGDTTNVASRICNVAQAGEVVLSAETAARLTDRAVPLVALPPAPVKGKNAPLRLFRIAAQGRDQTAAASSKSDEHACTTASLPATGIAGSGTSRSDSK